MLFQSFPFIFGLLPATFAAFWLARGRDARQAVLLVASYVFYGYWDWRFCGLLLLSSVVDYAAGLRIEAATRPSVRRAWLTLSLAVNLGALGFFKYWDFFAESTTRLLAVFGLTASAPLLDVALPLGISFYTFQSLSYTVDVYRGHTQATPSLLKFLTFVSLFPQLVAGPIVRWSELEGQLEGLARRFDPRLLALGACFFVCGLFKKVAIADWLGPRVYAGRVVDVGLLEVWPAYLGQAFWIYYDFSAYSDMAVGLGLAFGLRLPQNFDSPYRADSISDLWRRWHMTLGRFMRDYLFFAIGKRRKGVAGMVELLMIVFTLIGLWHGASWNMVFWGAYMGLGMSAEVVGRRRGWAVGSKPARRALVLLFWLSGLWLFSIAETVPVTEFFAAAAGAHGLGSPDWLLLAALAALCVHCLACPNMWQWKWRFTWWEAAALAAMFVYSVSRMFVEMPFFYFQF